MKKRKFSLTRLSGSFLVMTCILLVFAAGQDFYRGVATWWSTLLTLGLSAASAYGAYYMLVVNPDQAAREEREQHDGRR